MLNAKILNCPPLPAIALPLILIIVSLLAKLQVKGTVCGSVVLHFVAPSSDTPEPFVEKLTVLSVRQPDIWLLTSISIVPFLSGSSPALLNFHDCCDINVALVVPPDEDESSFLQPKRAREKMPKNKSLFLMDEIWM